ncbi:ubiquitin-activating enzyme E1 [Allomyces macrogynus ATCC 38327]|uniref:Ubiquitin-activating enzyme E1 1 n=1 Tax=Allomyces macrogynus (strain ATCC 38327) TaxID=578462 RepID=A0A0L0SPB8_ALLM3|nr:ubiquitin-activating enzyme E1 [Allomyces macrogynus ATCC 38327]|eukprot:KNE64348.1 ubiquitin-activating enzyme E1 [Allomyces macrogynus ATCC 38327]
MKFRLFRSASGGDKAPRSRGLLDLFGIGRRTSAGAAASSRAAPATGEQAAAAGGGDAEPTIDEGLYSRQIYALGLDAMKKMATSNVLVIGMKGLGVEIAKNVILAGVKSVTIYDPEPVQIADLSSQFFLTEDDLGKPRDATTHPKLAELNAYVPVSVLPAPLAIDTATLARYQVIVCTSGVLPWSQLRALNSYTRTHGAKYIAADTRGLAGMVFCDFGDDWECLDVNGEQPVTGMVAAIDEEGVVTCLDESRHGLEDGDMVTFTEVVGMEALNGAPARSVKVLGPYSFSIGDVAELGTYVRGGTFTQVKVPQTLHFASLDEAVKKPEFLVADYAKFDAPPSLHAGFVAIAQFIEKHGRAPRPRNAEDAGAVVALAHDVAKTMDPPVIINDDLVRDLAMQAAGDMNPMAAVLGGIVAQEVLKACSGKFHPIQQWLYLDAFEAMPTDHASLTETSCAPQGSRYDGLRAVVGSAFVDKLRNARELVVGSGAIGCELLKNLALSGVGTGANGHITVTDMDSIEKSNLNRQFLFRPWDVTKLKAVTAAAAVQRMNPDLVGHMTAATDRVGPETEAQFNDEFWASIDGVINALDNVAARRYMDSRCVFYEKPLLESGTLGTKGNTQVVLPHLTESYSSSQDPPEKSIPMCTLKNFPNQIEHTIQWARDVFEGLFRTTAENVNAFLDDKDQFVETALKTTANAKETLVSVETALTADRPASFNDCLVWARHRFELQFVQPVLQLLHNFPVDAVTSTGQPFWSGPKRAPKPLTFDAADPLHMEYIVHAAYLHAFNYGIDAPKTADVAAWRTLVANVEVPEFVPQDGVKIAVDDSDDAGGNVEATELMSVAEHLPDPAKIGAFRMTPADFEKDDDSNHHIDFITACSNLRAANYAIAPADRHKTKWIAGKIIPAIATTTAVVAGLVTLELYKVLDGAHPLEDFKNGFVNLALPFLGFSEPVAAPTMQYGETKFTLWDRFNVPGTMTLQELMDEFESKHGLEITMASSGVAMLYSFFMAPDKAGPRRQMPLRELVEVGTRKPIPEHAKTVVIEVTCSDTDGEDVDVPPVVVHV